MLHMLSAQRDIVIPNAWKANDQVMIKAFTQSTGRAVQAVWSMIYPMHARPMTRSWPGHDQSIYPKHGPSSPGSVQHDIPNACQDNILIVARSQSKHLLKAQAEQFRQCAAWYTQCMPGQWPDLGQVMIKAFTQSTGRAVQAVCSMIYPMHARPMFWSWPGHNQSIYSKHRPSSSGSVQHDIFNACQAND